MIIIASVVSIAAGCNTTSGALGGGAIGALAGQAIGGNTEATLIGAGVGALSGALVGDAVERDRARSYGTGYHQGYADGASRYTPPPPARPRFRGRPMNPHHYYYVPAPGYYYVPAPPPPPYYP
ncbi:MAG: glycine zipper 2TM domain-containing protein [bacterium]|nr:glycine zipper 2TM domain-containing protein [bacterium]